MSVAVPPTPAAVFVGDDDDDDKHPLIMHTCLCPSLGEGRVNEVNGGEVLLRRRRCCCKTNWHSAANATAANAANTAISPSPIGRNGCLKVKF